MPKQDFKGKVLTNFPTQLLKRISNKKWTDLDPDIPDWSRHVIRGSFPTFHRTCLSRRLLTQVKVSF